MSKIIQNQVGDWYPLMTPILHSQIFQRIAAHIRMRRAEGHVILPNTRDTFKAFRLCPLKDVKVVILGQDPYHDGSATGLAFANHADKRKVSPSLKNIITAVETDYGASQGVNVKGLLDVDITLESWARQGVLLLNTALSVEKGKAGSHTDLWKPFTKMIIEALSLYRNNLVFVLWGKKHKNMRHTLEVITLFSKLLILLPSLILAVVLVSLLVGILIGLIKLYLLLLSGISQML